MDSLGPFREEAKKKADAKKKAEARNPRRGGRSSRSSRGSARCYFSRELRGRPRLAQQFPFYIQYLEISNGCLPSQNTISGVVQQIIRKEGLKALSPVRQKSEKKTSEGEEDSNVQKILQQNIEEALKKQAKQNKSCCFRRRAGFIIPTLAVGGTIGLVIIYVGGFAAFCAFLHQQYITFDDLASAFLKFAKQYVQSSQYVKDNAGLFFDQTGYNNASSIVPLYTRENQLGFSKGGGTALLTASVAKAVLQEAAPGILQSAKKLFWGPSQEDHPRSSEEDETLKKTLIEVACTEMKKNETSWWTDDHTKSCKQIIKSLSDRYIQQIQEYQTLGIFWNLLFSGRLASFTLLGGSYLIEETPWVAICRLHGVHNPRKINEVLNSPQFAQYVVDANPIKFYHSITNAVGRDYGADLRPLQYSNYDLLSALIDPNEYMALPQDLSQQPTIETIEATKESSKDSSPASSEEKGKQVSRPSRHNRPKPVVKTGDHMRETVINITRVNTHIGRMWHSFSERLTEDMYWDVQNPETGQILRMIPMDYVREFYPDWRTGFLMLNGLNVDKQDQMDINFFVQKVLIPMKKVFLTWIKADAELLESNEKIQKDAEKRMVEKRSMRNALVIGSGLVLGFATGGATTLLAAATIGAAFHADQHNQEALKQFVEETATIMGTERKKTEDKVREDTTTDQNLEFRESSYVTFEVDSEQIEPLNLGSVPLWRNIPLDPQCQQKIEDYYTQNEKWPTIQGLDDVGQFFCGQFLEPGTAQFQLDYTRLTLPSEDPVPSLSGSANTARDRDQPSTDSVSKSGRPNVSDIFWQIPSKEAWKTRPHLSYRTKTKEAPLKASLPKNFEMKREYFEQPRLFIQEVLKLSPEDLQERKQLYLKIKKKFKSWYTKNIEFKYLTKGPTDIFVKIKAEQPEFGKEWTVQSQSKDGAAIGFGVPQTVEDYIVRYDLHVGRVNLINCLFHPLYYAYTKKILSEAY